MQMSLKRLNRALDNVTIFEFVAAHGERLAPALAGAHVRIKLPNGMQRQYSLLNSDSSPLSYLIAVKKEQNGRGGSRFLHEQLSIGNVVEVSAPQQCFALDERASHSVLIAGGIGITPIYSMRNQLRSLHKSYQLYYACRSAQQCLFLDHFIDDPNCHIYYSQPMGERMDIKSIVANAPHDSHFYCCGPVNLLNQFRQVTADLPTNRLHFECFQSSDTRPLNHDSYEVELVKSGKTLRVKQGQNLLHTLLEAGIAVNYSCEQGICGTCETRVIAGTPEHRDSLLSDAEKAANNSMMICCSGSKTQRLVLDL